MPTPHILKRPQRPNWQIKRQRAATEGIGGNDRRAMMQDSDVARLLEISENHAKNLQEQLKECEMRNADLMIQNEEQRRQLEEEKEKRRRAEEELATYKNRFFISPTSFTPCLQVFPSPISETGESGVGFLGPLSSGKGEHKSSNGRTMMAPDHHIGNNPHFEFGMDDDDDDVPVMQTLQALEPTLNSASADLRSVYPESSRFEFDDEEYADSTDDLSLHMDVMDASASRMDNYFENFFVNDDVTSMSSSKFSIQHVERQVPSKDPVAHSSHHHKAKVPQAHLFGITEKEEAPKHAPNHANFVVSPPTHRQSLAIPNRQFGRFKSFQEAAVYADNYCPHPKIAGVDDLTNWLFDENGCRSIPQVKPKAMNAFNVYVTATSGKKKGEFTPWKELNDEEKAVWTQKQKQILEEQEKQVSVELIAFRAKRGKEEWDC